MTETENKVSRMLILTKYIKWYYEFGCFSPLAILAKKQLHLYISELDNILVYFLKNGI